MSAKANTAAVRTLEIPESFAMTDETAMDAISIWSHLTGGEPMNWADPGCQAEIGGWELGELRLAAHGLKTVVQLSGILGLSHESRASADILDGLSSAAIALASSLDQHIDRIAERAGKSAHGRAS